MEKELVEYIAKSLVDNVDAVFVSEIEDERGTVLELKVAESDIGKVIGKNGRIARAMRTVIAASAGRHRGRVYLEILD